MDLALSDDPIESFKIFQGRIYDQYKKIRREFKFVIIDATKPPEEQQRIVLQVLLRAVDLSKFKSKSFWKELQYEKALLS